MFEPKPNEPNPNVNSAPQDMFAETEKTAEPARYDSASVAGEPTVMPQLGANAMKRGFDPTPLNNNSGLPEPLTALPDDLPTEGGNKKFFIIGIAVLVILVIVGIYFAYAKFFKNGFTNPLSNVNLPAVVNPSDLNKQLESEVLNINLEPTSVEEATTTENININNLETPQMTVPETVVTPALPVFDADQDGLTDDEEVALKTNPLNTDTDNDGLFDREEVKVYFTDPLNPDTDGDTYKDGEEVKNGYNPKGPGKLLPSSI